MSAFANSVKCATLYAPKHVALQRGFPKKHLLRTFCAAFERVKSFQQYGVKDYHAHSMHNTSSRATSTLYGVYSKSAVDYEMDQMKAADHIGRQQNHIWTNEEIDERLGSMYRHQPVTASDHVMNGLMYGLYRGFNLITGYREVNPTVKSMEWRLIVLESFAGVPGFVAAGFRHFKSLRSLQRDHGWIATLLEEAENERMHLLVCLHMFQASMLTRGLVISAQLTMTPFLMLVYAIKPDAMHRFVGYLEETACHTYANIIEHVETEGTELNTAWAHLPAPENAISYWMLPADATFLDTLRCMFADESHHRDVNHTFAEMGEAEPSPFALQHKQDALKAYKLVTTGETAWPSRNQHQHQQQHQQQSPQVDPSSAVSQ
eukprot:CAMPEP_0174966838 /NCGR_PEP_ID=MMETSP0004_2-20121128/7251_1 /TAXON_ID=420556 /ORGANISM="Ochromonas sp., Strain CCMP1393" /LENGTH=375 /DNA_ID=CAMNT_0016215905 /DNA_START=68 /DNA_END=1195 /DNA_ORIENTATION=-